MKSQWTIKQFSWNTAYTLETPFGEIRIATWNNPGEHHGDYSIFMPFSDTLLYTKAALGVEHAKRVALDHMIDAMATWMDANR